MVERVYLEDMGQIYNVSPLGDAKTWELKDLKTHDPLPPIIFVIDSMAGQKLFLGREKSGRHKFNMIRYLAKTIMPLFFEQLKSKELSQYLILRDSYPFDLQYAFGCSTIYQNILIPTNFVIIKDANNIITIGQYCGDTWLIPYPVLDSEDIIISFLKKAFSHILPKQIYLILICGTLKVLSRIYQECRNNEVNLIPIFSQCLFKKLEKDNPKFSVINSDSITTREFFKKASQRFQGKPMCCIGNLEETLYDPIKYSINTLWEMMTLKMDPDKEDWEVWSINVREEDFQKKVNNFNPLLLQYFQKSWK